jgi:hypothetical protein
MKKILMVLFLGIFAFTLVACNTSNTLDSEFDANALLETETDSIAFGAYTTVGLLSNFSGATAQITSPTRLSNTEYLNGNTTPAVESEIDQLNEYMSLFEAYTSDDANAVQVETVESTNPDYEFEVHYTMQNIDGTFSTYVIFYNVIEELDEEVDTEDEVDTDEEIDTEDEVDTDEEIDTEEDTEQEVRIEGSMFMNGVEYSLSGKIEESDGESKTKIVASIDEDNYVEMIEKIEDNESKFYFELVENGVTVQETRVKLEQEESENKIVLQFITDETDSEFVLKREIEDDEEVIKIQYDVDGVKGQIIVEETVNEDGSVTYSFFIKETGKPDFSTSREKEDYESEDDFDDVEEDDFEEEDQA